MLQKEAIQKISDIWIRQDLLVTWFFFKHDKKITSVFTCFVAFACFVVFETI